MNIKEYLKHDHESEEQYQAALYYFHMGRKRSVRATARALNHGYSTLQRWSADYNWVERARAYDRYVRGEAAGPPGNDQPTSGEELTTQRSTTVARPGEHPRKETVEGPDVNPQKWLERARKIREDQWEIAQELMNKARDILDTPLDYSESRWALKEVPRLIEQSVVLSERVVGQALEEIHDEQEPVYAISDEERVDRLVAIFEQARARGNRALIEPEPEHVTVYEISA
ncbi:MAG: hypothetical protein HC837_21405 [Chloroflexaceae bacterium]|nr:hypothetical protein [Chloroflexaceae bacterium]